MLLADKHNLQNELKLNLLHIEEQELNYYTTNCYTVGTSAALLAGFAFAGLMEVDDGVWVDDVTEERVVSAVSMQIAWGVSCVLALCLVLGVAPLISCIWRSAPESFGLLPDGKLAETERDVRAEGGGESCEESPEQSPDA